MPPPVALELDSARIRAALDGKREPERFNEGEYYRRGFKRGWLVKTPADNAPGESVVRLALWLELPPEFLYHAAPEYEEMPIGEVLSRASLDFFFKRHKEGREAAPFREDFEQHLAAHTDHAPRTVDGWAAWFDAFQRGRARERRDAHRLERSVPKNRSDA